MVVGGTINQFQFLSFCVLVQIGNCHYPFSKLFTLNDSIGSCTCRISLAFRLMPQGNAVLDCSPIAAAGHVIPQSYVPISVSQFMDDLSAEEDILLNCSDNNHVSPLPIPEQNKLKIMYKSILDMYVDMYVFFESLLSVFLFTGSSEQFE